MSQLPRQLTLAAVALTASGRVQLLPGEVELKLLDKVDIEFPDGGGGLPGDAAAKFLAGILSVTSHRLVWLSAPGAARRALGLGLACVSELCPAQKQQLFGSRTPRLRLRVCVDGAGVVCNGPTPTTALLSFAFRGVAPADLAQQLQAALAKRAWDAPAPPVKSLQPGGAGSDQALQQASLQGTGAFSASNAGVAGILRRHEAAQRELGQSVDEAFTDLSALMEKAREMLAFAERMRASLQRDAGDVPEELESYFLSMGIASPVTRQTAGALFHQQLALQLADFLVPRLEKAQGVMTLPDTYCLFNRARGTELVSPEDLIKACSLWEKLLVGLRLRRFDSGVLVVQSLALSEEKVTALLLELADKCGDGICATDVARHLGLTPAITREYLLAAESRAVLCRDDAPDGLRFYRNPWRTSQPQPQTGR